MTPFASVLHLSYKLAAACLSRVISIASLHSIGDSANPFNLCFNNIAVVQVDRRLPRETDSRGRARCDQVPWIEREAMGKIGHDLRNVEDQLIRIGILHDFAVQTCGDSKCAGIGNLESSFAFVSWPAESAAFLTSTIRSAITRPRRLSPCTVY